jgi:hypothetical protein
MVTTVAPIRLICERVRPDLGGRVTRNVQYVSSNSPIGRWFVGQERAVRVEIVTHLGETISYTTYETEPLG